MWPELFAEFALLVVAAFAAVLFVPRILRPRRITQDAGTAAVSPERIPAASGGMAVPPVIEVQPSSVMSGPFAYDNGLVVQYDAEGDTS